MSDTPEMIYLTPGECDGEPCIVWCDDPAPSPGHDPAEAVEYVRKDKHDEIVAAKCDAPVGWISPERFKAQSESKMGFFKKLKEAKKIITDLVEYAEQNDPGCPHIGRAKGFLGGGDQ